MNGRNYRPERKPIIEDAEEAGNIYGMAQKLKQEEEIALEWITLINKLYHKSVKLG